MVYIKVQEKNMKTIDELMEMMKNGEWHTLDELGATLQIKEDLLVSVIHILKEFGFIEIDDKRVRLNPSGRELLKLPRA